MSQPAERGYLWSQLRDCWDEDESPSWPKVESIVRAIFDLSAHPAPISKGVTVKALEWDDWWAEHSSYSGTTKRRIMERGLTPFNAYFIEQSSDDESWWLLEGLLGREIAGPFEECGQARSAAQADFDARVKSCLSHTAGEIE